MINFLPKQWHWPSPGGEKSELIKQRVKAFIQRQTARRLAALGGQATDIELAPSRREDAPAS